MWSRDWNVFRKHDVYLCCYKDPLKVSRVGNTGFRTVGSPHSPERAGGREEGEVLRRDSGAWQSEHRFSFLGRGFHRARRAAAAEAEWGVQAPHHVHPGWPRHRPGPLAVVGGAHLPERAVRGQDHQQRLRLHSGAPRVSRLRAQLLRGHRGGAGGDSGFHQPGRIWDWHCRTPVPGQGQALPSPLSPHPQAPEGGRGAKWLAREVRPEASLPPLLLTIIGAFLLLLTPPSSWVKLGLPSLLSW